ncbi:MAG: ribulokinase [Christensenellaceae bacterium]|jgi:L-ribulokinase
MAYYTIGIDFGTLSGRAVLVDVSNGKEICSSTYEYPHAVMDETLPSGIKLGHDWALQHPQDYLEVLYHTIPALLKESGVLPTEVIGIGTDFTASTPLPVLEDGTPLCFLEAYQNEPHAYVKLWKHHAAQDKANKLNEIATKRGEAWLQNYGGKISSEWVFPKLWQILDEAPEIYAAMDGFVEAADWIVWQLTGLRTQNSCTAGYKKMFNKTTGFPSKEFFAALDPRLEDVIAEKIGEDVISLGACAGTLTEKMAAKLGLPAGIAVAVGNVDAHVCVPAVGIVEPGNMLAIIGTSTCHIMIDTKEVQVPGICGVVADGVLPSFYGCEAGQSCVGDHFAWVVENCTPTAYAQVAKKQGLSLHEYLTEQASLLQPGESGLLALDWWNGNRSVLVDVDLTGLLLGMTLQTKPEEIYRALIEATAFGTRVLIENYRAHGIAVNAFYASGGISQKNPFMMQVYADVLNMPVHIAGAAQGPALGSAIFAAVAAGQENGGYDSVFDAAQQMAKPQELVYLPNAKNHLIYHELYEEYKTLHDYFGCGENDVMKRLKRIKAKQTKE